MLHPDIGAGWAIQFVVVISFRGQNLLVHVREGSDFFRREYLIVMLNNFLKFSGMKPFTFTVRTNFNYLAVVFT